MAPAVNAPLYTTDVLRLAAQLPEATALERIDGSAEQRSPTCGSVVRTEVQIAPDGSLAALSQQVQACAFGQAAATLVATGSTGRTRDDIVAATHELAEWLAGSRADPGHWPGLEALAPARGRSGRHGAIMLPFRSLLAAMESGQ